MYNQVTDIDGLKSLVGLRDLRFDYNQVSNLSPVSRLTKLQILAFCYNPYTDISPIASLSNALHIRLDKAFEELAKTLVSAETNIIACPFSQSRNQSWGRNQSRKRKSCLVGPLRDVG